MGDVYVFFYCKNGGDQSCTSPGPGSKPSAPLMLYYNKGYYKPADIDQYFQKWVCEKELAAISSQKPCGGDTNYQTLATSLNNVNKSLNRICLTHKIGGTTSQYGISKPSQPLSTTPNIELDRIKVTKIPGKPTQTRPYCKVVHRTSNGFRIGEIYYNKQNITEGGVTINNGGGGNITVEGGNNHTSFVTPPGDNKPNTVVAYYHTGDNKYTLPQLIVLLQTDKAIGTSDAPITSTHGSKYGYYVLATGTGGFGYQYEWRTVNDVKPDPLTLDYPTEFQLLNSIIILVEKQKQYDESDISGAVTSATIRSPGNMTDVNRLKDRQITIGDKTEDNGKCVSKYGYKLFEHDLSTVTATIHGIKPILGLRFLIPSTKAEGNYDEIKLHSDDKAEKAVGPLYHTSTQATVYVYFYGSDPRPLLMCYGTSAYIPQKLGEPEASKQVNVSYAKWVRESKIKSCICSGESISDNNKEILETLLKVVLFLNPVQLNPKMIPSNASGEITKPLEPPKAPKDTTYELHQYKYNSHVKMKITRHNVECYEKYTYEPVGTGSSGNGFRLGNVIYDSGTSGTKPKGTLEYNAPCSKYRYDPLLKATVYYYDADKGYDDPLLIELDFQVNVGDSKSESKKQYFKMIKRDTQNITWQIDKTANDNLSGDQDNKKLITYLDSIRYGFKKLVRIEIQHNLQKQYDLKGRQASGSSGSGFVDIGSDNHIQVVECSDDSCTKLKENNYTCFKHTLAGLQADDHHQIGGVVMTLPSKNRDTEAVEIPIYDTNDQANSGDQDQPKQLYYNSCMNDLIVHVYFYIKTSTKDVDNVPLMLCYNSNYYKPIDRDDYLHLWHHEPSLNSAEPCKKDDMIKTHLDLINKALNRIDLTHQITSGSTSQYGIPTDKPPPKNPAISLNRIQVTTIPAQAKETRPYVKLIHRTVNDFRIGEIWYGSKNIISSGVELNGGDTIKVDSPNHTTKFVTSGGSNRPNTVVAYYSTSDSGFKLPQLIVLMTTDNLIDDRQQKITASTDTRYGYYILATGKSGVGYQYEWREPNETSLTLNDETELSLLNSVVILVEHKPITQGGSTDKYGDEKINNAVQKAIQLRSLTKSPGLQNNDINRLKGKDITPTDVTTQAQGLDQTGFRAISHDLSKIVDPKIDGAQDVTLIAILRFLIPTPKGDGEYTVLNLYESVQRKENTIFFHQKNQDSVCVYFYNQDPRPLLLCYNNKAYRAFSIPSYDNQRWYKAPKVSDCACTTTKSKYLLLALIKISNTLNPVEIQTTTGPSYNIHKFNGQQISIKITETPGSNGFCYNKYVHTHNGTGSGGTGFRLGIINYKSLCIQDSTKKSLCISSLTSHKPKYNPASEVVVYYYKGDPNHQNPLLVALKNSLGTYKPYYVLEKDTKTEHKNYKKENKIISLDTTKGGQLEKILDSLLYKGNKILQINLGFRTKIEVKYHGEFGEQKTIVKNDKYQATVYENQSTKLRKTTEKIPVEVSEPINIKTGSGNETGYQCYQHKLLNIDNINNFGGLILLLYEAQLKPIKLYEHCYQTSDTQTQEITPIAYTACKGDLYVFLCL